MHPRKILAGEIGRFMQKSETENLAGYLLLFNKIEQAYDAHMSNALKEYALTPNEIIVLSLADGNTTASQIALLKDVSKALVSRSVKLLRQKGYIVCELSPSDKREQRLILTPDGVKLKAKIIDEMSKFSKAALKGFDDERQAALRLLLKYILKNIDGGR